MLLSKEPRQIQSCFDFPVDACLQEQEGQWWPVTAIKPGTLVKLPQVTSVPQYIFAKIFVSQRRFPYIRLIVGPNQQIIPEAVFAHKCLEADSPIETPEGQIAVQSLTIGDRVWGFCRGRKMPVQIKSLQIKETILTALEGKSLSPALKVTSNHLIYYQGRFVHAWQTDFPTVLIAGSVYDLETESGNYFSEGFLMQPGE